MRARSYYFLISLAVLLGLLLCGLLVSVAWYPIPAAALQSQDLSGQPGERAQAANSLVFAGEAEDGYWCRVYDKHLFFPQYRLAQSYVFPEPFHMAHGTPWYAFGISYDNGLELGQATSRAGRSLLEMSAMALGIAAIAAGVWRRLAARKKQSA